MKCPICQKPVDPNNPEAPFCSERCQLLDLGNWAAGKYVISRPIDSRAEDESDEDEP